jgi:uncharacterized protein (TIGR02996 family)
MLIITIETRGQARELAFDKETVTVGSEPGCDVVVPKAAKSHATISIDRADRVVIQDHDTFWGTKLDGRKVRGRVEIGDGTIAIGKSTLRVRRVAPPDLALERMEPVERELVRATARGDDASRLVYADWLEERQDHARARFLRLQHAIATMDPQEDLPLSVQSQELRTLAEGLDPAWRRAVAKIAIERCVSFELQCPKQWSALQPTEQSDVRYCGACSKQVFYCTTIESAQRRARRDECIAVDVRLGREPGDLEPVIRMGTMVAHRRSSPEGDNADDD